MPPYDRAQTTKRIFDAAVQEFAAEGIAGARVDRIAAMADSNKAQIYNYFGNKEKLFAKVLQHRLTDLADAVTLNSSRVDEYIGELFDFMTANPDVLRLVQHEAVHFSITEVPERQARTAHYQEKVDVVSAAQRNGSVDKTLDPSFVVMSLVSLVSWFVAAPQITEMIIGKPDDPNLRAKYRSHLVTMARRMLTPDSC
jgi:AcrR family transcriptional regulator